MNNAKAFGKVLAGIRKEQGYPSAHQFFKSAGGSRNMGIAFVSYWDMERGKKLPKSWRLKAIIAALGIEQRSPRAQELVRAYFKALSGSDELLDIISGPVAAEADLPSRELAEAATQQAIARRTVNLTLEQWKLRVRDLVTHLCQAFLTNTEGWVTVRELAAATGFEPKVIKKTLKAMDSGGLVKFSGEKVRGLFTDKVIKAIPVTKETFPIISAMSGHWKAWLTNSKIVGGRLVTLRMTEANLKMYLQHLEKAVRLACVYEDAGADREESGIYLVKAEVFDVFPGMSGGK